MTIAAYQPGSCNIGPAEIARRRRAGHIALFATVVLFAVLLAIDAPPLARFIVALPVAGAASGYLQAWVRFCAGFGSRGIFNFGQLGQTVQVTDADALGDPVSSAGRAVPRRVGHHPYPGRDPRIDRDDGRVDRRAARNAHAWWNPSDEPARVLVEFRPALRTETFFRQFFGLARDGKVNSQGLPGPLQLARFERGNGR